MKAHRENRTVKDLNKFKNLHLPNNALLILRYENFLPGSDDELKEQPFSWLC